MDSLKNQKHFLTTEVLNIHSGNLRFTNPKERCNWTTVSAFTVHYVVLDTI